MTNNNQLALIVAYYLSRCDKDAYIKLGYSSFNQAAEEIGRVLDVKANTIKNMRDEFDPHHENKRVGWLKEPRGSRLKVLRSFQDTDDSTLFEIVQSIIHDKDFKKTEEYSDIQQIFSEQKNIVSNKSPVFILRGPTGRKAEEFFKEHFAKNGEPVNGILIDKRDEGCGYDFEIQNGNNKYFIEIKGLAADRGGILFTNKEWQTAVRNNNNYFLVLVKNIAKNPELKIIKNPAGLLKTKKNIYTTVQLNWSVSDRELNQFLSKG